MVISFTERVNTGGVADLRGKEMSVVQKCQI